MAADLFGGRPVNVNIQNRGEFMMDTEKSTQYGLLAIRVTIFILMIIWAVLKIMAPESYAGGDEPGIFEKFYGVAVGSNIVFALGIAQIVLLLAYVLGAFKTITVGAVMLMNLASLVVSLPLIIDFGTEKNILFLTAIPVFGASLAHFLMRKQDTFLSLEK